MSDENNVEKTQEELEAEAKAQAEAEAQKDLDIKEAIKNGSTNEDIASSFGVDADRIARLRGDVEVEKAEAKDTETNATDEGVGEGQPSTDAPADGEATPA